MTLDALIDRYCELWTETDAARRAVILQSVWANDGRYSDPFVHNFDATRLLAHIAKVLPTRPGATLRRVTAIDEHHGLLRFGFEVRSPAGELLRHGVDFVQLDAAGTKIARVIGFFGALEGRA